MIRIIKAFKMTCDHCGKELDDETIFTDEASLYMVAKESGWREIGARDLCPDCYHIDENDEYVENEKGDTK